MPMTKLTFKPGLNRERTFASNEGGWYAADKVRFRFGLPEKIKGWVKRSEASFLGSCRALHAWTSLNLDSYLGIGTSSKYYIDFGTTLYDITPLRTTTSAGEVTFSASNASSTLVVTDTAHGAQQGDFVTFSGAVALGGGGTITAAILNQEYKIDLVVDANTYNITARAVASVADITVDGQYTPTAVAANASDTGNGGGSVVGAYQINTGLDSTIFGSGWGAGVWNAADHGWGEAATTIVQQGTLRIWTHDNFGEDLLLNVRDGGIYYWDKSSGLTNAAVDITSLAGANSTPTVSKHVLVSDRDRHVLAFGCDTEANPGVQDPLAIRFSSQESLTDWAATATNTAGELRLGSGSEIVSVVETRQQILVFTDKSLYAMQYLGPPFTFGVNVVSENTSIISPLSTVAVQDNVFWMGDGEFYAYGGTVNKIPCSVKDYVFDDINRDQLEKIFAALNASNSEVWWFYPSSGSDNVDSYVLYNYVDRVWSYGTLARTAWLDRGINSFPIAASVDGYLYDHERGYDDGSTNPASAISSFIQSSPITLGDGERFAFIRRLLPDISFLDSSNQTAQTLFTLKANNFPGGDFLQSSANNVTLSNVAADENALPVQQYTNQINMRLRGRSISLRIDSTDTGLGWRLGTPSIDVRLDGKR